MAVSLLRGSRLHNDGATQSLRCSSHKLAIHGFAAVRSQPTAWGGSMGGIQMDKFFGNLGAVLVSGLVVAILIALFPDSGYANSVGAGDLWLGIFQWLHVFFGITWIGLLYYFNFVQVPTMPKVPAELKPGVT